MTQSGSGVVPGQPTMRLAEVLAALALATDLASGLQLEHSLRRTVIAAWLGQESGLAGDELRDAFYVALLGSVGCVVNGAALAQFVGDEIAFRADMFERDMADPLVTFAYFSRNVARGEPPVRRAASWLAMARKAPAICRDVALNVGGMLNLGPAVREALGQCDEHWNGKGGVLGLAGDRISLYARLFRLAQDIDVFHRRGGMDAAVAVAQARAGTYYDPQLTRLFVAGADRLEVKLQAASTWEEMLAAEPDPPRSLTAEAFDEVAEQIANVIDVRSVYTIGHSRAVAALAESTAIRLGLGSADARLLRSAGLLHDLGRAGIAVALWDKPGPLTPDERTSLERHPAITEQVLARSAGLGPLGVLAGLHHERLDGSGYRGITASSLPVTARILAAADAHQSKLEARAYRGPMTPDQSAELLLELARTDKLDAEVVQALLASGHGEVSAETHRAETRRAETHRPAGLSNREVEVLRLLVRGLSNRDIADALFLSPKTVGRHIENIYTKANVRTRVGATLFAVSHGIAGTAPAAIRH